MFSASSPPLGNLWDKTVLLDTPGEGLAPRLSLDAPQVILHGIGVTTGHVLLRGDLTLVPDLIISWPSIWTRTKLLHAECSQSLVIPDSSFDIAIAWQRYSVINNLSLDSRVYSSTSSQTHLAISLSHHSG
jgi:hypothetical protein